MRNIVALTVALGINIMLFAQPLLGIEEALNIAIYNNFEVMIAKNQAQMAANFNTLGNAGFLPTVNAGAVTDASVRNTNLQFFTGEEVDRNNARNQNLNAFVELNWTVFDGFKMFATKNKLDELEKYGRYEMLFRIEVVASQVMSLYYQLVQENKYLEILNQTLAISNERVNLAETRLNIGSGSELQALNAITNRNADSSAVLQQQLLIKNIKADFNLLLGRQPTVDFAVSSDFIFLNTLDFSALTEEAEKQNKALLIARTQVAVASNQIREAQSAYYPRVNLFGAYDFNTSQNEVGVVSRTRSFGPALGASLTWNLFNGLNDKIEIQNRKMAFENAELDNKLVDLEVQTNLYKSYNDYTVWKQLLALESVNVEAAEEDVRIAKTNLDLGGLNDVEFRVIQISALNAEYRLLLAEYRTRLAEIELMRLSGRLAQALKL
jgi:outer membrane protein TolC